MKKRKILSLFLACSLAATMFGTVPASAEDMTLTPTTTSGTLTITLKIKGTPDAPAAPTKASATKNSITLTAVDGCEYSKDGTNWQDSPTFTGLTPGTEYSFYQRKKADEDNNASPASTAAKISTLADTYALTITLVIKPTQTITASDVTATYGDTGKSVSASVTTPAAGGGAISYAVKSGSEDYIAVNASTGALTIKKAGTATVIVTAAATDEYAETTKEVTVTVSKADNPATVTSTATVTKGGTVDLSGNVTLNGATGNVTYAISGDENGCTLNGSVLTSGENAGEVTVNVTVAEDDNHEALTATPITVTILDHTHTMTHYSASSGNCQTLGHVEYWYCSGCQKYFSDADGNTEITYEQTRTSYGSHRYVWTTVTDATCTEPGEEAGECSRCHKTTTRAIPALGHKYDPDTHLCIRCKQVDPEAFPAYKTAQKAAIDALAESTDSAASKKLITDAKAAIDAVTYVDTKTFAENAAVIDTVIEQLKTDLAAQRAKDALLREFDAYKTAQKKGADALARDTDSEASKKLIADAKAAIDALVYDETKTLDENKAAVDAIVEKLKSDLSAQRIKDDAENEFAIYKTEQKAVADSLAETGDSDKCKALITAAKSEIDALTYDSTKTFVQNTAAVDAIIEKLKADLAAQRNEDNYEKYNNEFEAYKTNRKAYADTLAKESDNKAEKRLIDAAKAEIAALEYDKSKSLAENKARVDDIIAKLQKDIDAYWATVSFTVSFLTYCDTELAPVTVSYGTTVAEPATLTREGYNLVGWLLDGAAYDFTKPVKANLTLAANWAPIKYNVTLMVNGQKHSEQVVEHGKRVVFPEIAVSEGKKLFGWSLDPELTIGFTAITPVTENLVLYAEERDAAKVLIDGEKTDSLDSALAALGGEDDFINLYEDQELKKLKFPKGDTSIVIDGNGNALSFTGTANIAPKQELALDDITITAANKNGKPQNITLNAAAGGLYLSDVTLEGKNANIKGSKGNVTLGDIDSSKCAQLNVTGNKKTTINIEGEVDATKVTGSGTVTISDTLTITKTLTADNLIIEAGAVLNIASGATVTVKNSLSGYGTIHLAKGYKALNINGTVSGRITITADEKVSDKTVLFKAKASNLNDVFDISAIVPDVTDGEYEYGLYVKSGKAIVRAFRLMLDDTAYCEWSDIVTVIKNRKANGANYTVELLGNVDLGSSFKMPDKGKYAGLTIDGGGYTITFKGKALSLTGDTTFTNVTVKSTDGAWTVKTSGFKLNTINAELVNCTEKIK